MALALYLGLRSLGANRRTTLILAASVTLAVAVVLVMASLLLGFQQEFISKTVNSSAHVHLTADELENSLQPALARPGAEVLTVIDHVKPTAQPNKIRNQGAILDQLRQDAQVLTAAPYLTTSVLIKYGTISYPATVYGVLPEEEQALTGIYDKAVAGRFSDLKTQDKGVVVGSVIARKLGLEVGSNLRIAARSGATYLFRVVAIVRTGITSQDDSRIWLNLKDAQTLAEQYNEITDIGVKLADYRQAQPTAERMARQWGYRTESWQEANANILGLLRIIFGNMFFILSGLILAAGFGIYNVFSMSVLDRRRDLAILLTMGVRAATIRNSFVIQGLAVGTAAGAAGLLLGAGLIQIFGIIKLGPSDMRPTDAAGFVMLQAWWLYGGAFILGLLLALLSAVLPARKAGRVNPVDVIREG